MLQCLFFRWFVLKAERCMGGSVILSAIRQSGAEGCVVVSRRWWKFEGGVISG